MGAIASVLCRWRRQLGYMLPKLSERSCSVETKR